ncbi:LNK2-like protein [Drosera capensis]
MFDWDDQELANILWGEADEPEDHIVPYPEGIEKDSPPVVVVNEKTVANAEDGNKRAPEQQIQDSERNFEGVELDGDSSIYGSRGSEDPQPATSVAAGLIADGNVAAPIQHGHEDPEGQCEDEDLGELIDNSWADIGSFDDLDRIFSNDDLAANSKLGSTDELWSSSKDIIAEADESSFLALDAARWEADFGIAPGDFDINNESFSYESSSFVPAPETPRPAYDLHGVSANLDLVKHGVDTGVPSLDGKVGTQNKLTVDPSPSARMEVTPDQLSHKNWSKSKSKYWRKINKVKDRRPIYSNVQPPAAAIPQCDSHGAPSFLQNYSSFVIAQKRSSQGPGLPYPQFHNQYVASHSDIYGNLNNQYAALPSVRSTDDNHQSALSGPEADVVSINKSSETSSRPMNMTPQEKIEKLRKRQKIHAMLAIQKQRQQLTHQVSVAINSVAHETPNDQRFHTESSCVPAEDNLGIPNHTSFGEDGNTVEDTILQQLHDIVDKVCFSCTPCLFTRKLWDYNLIVENFVLQLDITIRLCIRDSLFRLAQSASQRQYVNEKSSTYTSKSNTRKPDAAREDTSSADRLGRTPVAETETNHIDRVVAHLLFHRPLDFSIKPSGTPESSYTRASTGQKTDTSSQQLGHLTPRTKHQHDPSPKGSKRAFPSVELHQDDVSDKFQQSDLTNVLRSLDVPKQQQGNKEPSQR